MVKNQSAQSTQTHSEKHPSSSKWIYILSGSLLAIAITSYFFIPDFQAFVNKTYNILTSNDRKQISEYISNFGFWGPVVIILVMVVQMFLIVIPSWLLMIVSVLAYGQFWGVVLSVAAVGVAATIAYFIGKALNEAAIGKLLGIKTERKMQAYLEQYGFGAVIIFRLAPFLSNDAISFISGMLRMSYWKFMGATMLGIIPLSILIALFGKNTDQLKSGLLWIGGVCLLLYIGYIFYEQRKKKH
ncbi:MAG: VTT domain-containing protein [Saprospiraceae bacterium]